MIAILGVIFLILCNNWTLCATDLETTVRDVYIKRYNKMFESTGMKIQSALHLPLTSTAISYFRYLMYDAEKRPIHKIG